MPELPEVESLRRFLAEHCTGRVIARIDLTAFSALKTFTTPLTAFAGMEIQRVERHGKFLCLDAGGLWLCFHLARAYKMANKMEDYRRCRDLTNKLKLDRDGLDPTDKADLSLLSGN